MSSLFCSSLLPFRRTWSFCKTVIIIRGHWRSRPKRSRYTLIPFRVACIESLLCRYLTNRMRYKICSEHSSMASQDQRSSFPVSKPFVQTGLCVGIQILSTFGMILHHGSIGQSYFMYRLKPEPRRHQSDVLLLSAVRGLLLLPMTQRITVGLLLNTSQLVQRSTPAKEDRGS